MIIATFEQWKTASIEHLEAANPEVECPTCEGDGVFYEDCHCCGQETEIDCALCDGAGVVLYSDASGLCRDQFNRREYFRAVIRDLRKWCAFTRQDFLEVAGHFVSEFREGRYV
ncbi:hypothetical protein [Marinobacter sp. CA1]|uniref:hypothetical protein n=1 Tax=Marinobacter sp. CA1 TaxID=2817656 RepID=UPI001D08EA7A|nr:hypothetical protein [Marinobacter sp. CA1]UDL04017.1 hypothetical protein J2887_15015 [Marinobacter sp. CA1]